MQKPAHFTAAILVAMMMTAPAVYAAGETATPPETSAAAPPGEAKLDPEAEAARKAEEALVFKNRKAESLLFLKNRVAETQKKEACVSAAQDMKALAACGPVMAKGGGFPGMMFGKKPPHPAGAPGDAAAGGEKKKPSGVFPFAIKPQAPAAAEKAP